MHIEEHKPLSDLTTFKIGGTARYFAEVTSVVELHEALSFAAEKGIPHAVLGGGSNVLISSGEIDKLFIKVGIGGITWQRPEFSIFNFQFSKKKESIVIAGAGESWDGLVAQAVTRGLWGIENLAGIPGTVGAAPVQNIGAYGVELKDVLAWVEVFDTTNVRTEDTNIRTRRLSAEECRFGYRDSIFKHEEGKHLIVTRVALRLKKDGKPNLEYKDLREKFKNQNEKSKITLKEIRDAVLEIRARKFPDLRTTGTAGSFFKNPIIPKAQYDELKKKYPDLPGFPVSNVPTYQRTNVHLVKVPLAWILDNICHLKGLAQGNVGLFKNQPIVLVNLGGATADEVRKLADEVIACVKEKTEIDVEWEVRMIQ